MYNLAESNTHTQPFMEYGTVREAEGRNLAVNTQLGTLPAETAVSCLVRPGKGDTVLVSSDGAGGNFVLAVLTRPENGTTTEVNFEGDVIMRVQGGRLAVTADKELLLASQRDISMASETLAVHAQKGSVSITKLSYLGRKFTGQIKHMRIVAESVENTFRRLTQRLKDAFRFVEELEEVQSGSTRYVVEDTLTMHSQNAVHMAEEVVTINAQQVHLG
jgi:Protein of unknown function (DUF3540)